MYNATLYLNTGFNAVNIPDSKATLDLATSVTVPALDLFQARELASFTIKANYSDIRNADYLYLVNDQDATDFAFYSIQNITMTSLDTAVLSVTMDYILTAGGATSLVFLDGLTERHHIATADDKFGAYDEDDPYLTPAEMLRIETETPIFYDPNDPGSKNDVTIIESTVDLYWMHGDKQANDLNSMSFNYSSDSVLVPSVKSSDKYSSALMETPAVPHYTTLLPWVEFYIVRPDLHWSPGTYVSDIQDWVPDALGCVRSLGIESCIISQYAIPYYMIKNTELAQGYQTSSSSSLGQYTGRVETLHGTYKTVGLSALPFERAYTGFTVRNKRLFYGDNVKYHIVSIASGNEAEFMPEEIFNFSAQTPPVYPTIEMRVDPRPDGCPYFRFDIFRNDNTEDLFFTNAVKGLQWQNVPLVYQGASGSLINQYKYNAQNAINQRERQYAAQKDVQQMQKIAGDIGSGVVGGIGSAVVGAATGASVLGVPGAIAGAAGGIMSAAGAYMQGMEQMKAARLDSDYHTASYLLNKNQELQSLLIANNVVAPAMNFPISEGIRDFVGNSCLVYRTYYSDNDVQRLDKILTMYGYKHITPITSALLTNRAKFNYIQAKGVTIGNTNIPRWIREGVATQFEVGTRIWHVLPDTAIYTNGTNI